jgi:MFS transporter, PPP family, 3-phenylpropionic acid transporter
LSALFRFILLYAALYAAFGMASPFMPEFFAARGLEPQWVGIVLAGGTAMRLVSGGVAGPIGDRLRALRLVLILCLAVAGLATLGYLPAGGFWLLFTLSLTQAAALGPVTMLADALALDAAARPRPPSRGFEYGVVRGAGSAAFVAGTLLSGQAVPVFGLNAIIWGEAVLLGVAALWARLVPEPAAPAGASDGSAGPPRAGIAGVIALLRLPAFRSLMIVAMLVLGSHAMHDGFAVIRWTAAGIGPVATSLLWSESVVGEVVVFFAVGPVAVARLGPAVAMMVAAAAGALRWAVEGETADVLALALVQPLHGLTFALLHLACMRVIAEVVPPGLAGTAQAVYGTGIGVASMVLTLVSGELYAVIGPRGFWVMSGVCVLALPVAFGLRQGTGLRVTTQARSVATPPRSGAA